MITENESTQEAHDAYKFSKGGLFAVITDTVDDLTKLIFCKPLLCTYCTGIDKSFIHQFVIFDFQDMSVSRSQLGKPLGNRKLLHTDFIAEK